MITLIQAIKLLDIEDDEIINFSTKSKSHNNKMSDPWANVGLLRKSVDMKRIDIRKIGTDYYAYDPGVSWEFVVSEKDLRYLKGVLMKY
jgi:hypothetical protein